MITGFPICRDHFKTKKYLWEFRHRLKDLRKFYGPQIFVCCVNCCFFCLNPPDSIFWGCRQFCQKTFGSLILKLNMFIPPLKVGEQTLSNHVYSLITRTYWIWIKNICESEDFTLASKRKLTCRFFLFFLFFFWTLILLIEFLSIFRSVMTCRLFWLLVYLRIDYLKGVWFKYVLVCQLR